MTTAPTHTDGSAVFVADALQRIRQLESDRARDQERIRALEEQREAVIKELIAEREYGMRAGASVKALEEWRRKCEDADTFQRGRNQVLDQEARDDAAAAQDAADTAQTSAELADSRAQRASWQVKALTALTLALTIALSLVQHFTGQPPPPQQTSEQSSPSAETNEEGSE